MLYSFLFLAVDYSKEKLVKEYRTPIMILFVTDLSKVVLTVTHNSLETSVEGIFITGTLNVNNESARVVDCSSNIDHMTESSSNGDFLNTDEV